MLRRQQPIDGGDVVGARRVDLLGSSRAAAHWPSRAGFGVTRRGRASSPGCCTVLRIEPLAGPSPVSPATKSAKSAAVELVDAAVADPGADPVQLGAMASPGRVGDVDARREPAFSGRDHGRASRRLGEHGQVGNANRGELASDPPLASRRLAHRLERARVTDTAAAPEEPPLDVVTRRPGAGRSAPDPGARHRSRRVGS